MTQSRSGVAGDATNREQFTKIAHLHNEAVARIHELLEARIADEARHTALTRSSNESMERLLLKIENLQKAIDWRKTTKFRAGLLSVATFVAGFAGGFLTSYVT